MVGMEMFSPMNGPLRRTNYQGVEVTLGLSDRDVSINAKIGHVQVSDVSHWFEIISHDYVCRHIIYRGHATPNSLHKQ